MDRASVLPTQFSYDFLREITDGFSEERFLGRGGYGEVYMGVRKDGTKVAVKVFNDKPGFDDELYKKEFNNLMCLQHHNIVRLIGFCHETEQPYVPRDRRVVLTGRTYRALCFEYMHNKSLKEYFDKNDGHDWHTRYRIIKGIWNGLMYLHKELKPPMYHLDLKPDNILLDEKMVPKIADFGVSRLFIEEQATYAESVPGTPGYIPPEYTKRKEISNKFDIFSLGVVTMQIIAGFEGYDKFPDMRTEQFIELVHGKWRNRLQETSVEEPEPYVEQVRTCIEIAIKCVASEPDKRPIIEDIVNKITATETMIRLGPSLQERLSKIENLFGELVGNNKLDNMQKYMGKPKTQEDQALEARNLINEDDKDGKASRYVYSNVPMSTSFLYGRHGTFGLIYNATGNTLYYVANNTWHGKIGKICYPKEIGNGQWAAFHHALKFEWIKCSMAAVVYRGTTKVGKDQDYLLAWSHPSGFFDPNKIGGVNHFQTRWAELKEKLLVSEYSSNAKSNDGGKINVNIGKGFFPTYTAIITYL